MTDRASAEGLREAASAAMDALRDEVDPDEDSRCVDCGVELEDGNYTLICRECADVDD